MKASMFIVRTVTILLLAVVAVVGILFLLRYDGPGTSNNNQTVDTATNDTKSVPEPIPIVLYYVALGDDGKAGERIGCGDSLVPTVSEPVSTGDALSVAMKRLLAERLQTVSDTQLYNALYEADLSLVRATVIKDTATIELNGSLNLRGTCDGPRVEAQLAETAKTASGADKIEIYLNGSPLADALSQR